MSEINISGRLSNIRHHAGGRIATLTHPEARATVLFPDGLVDDLVHTGSQVRVAGRWQGDNLIVAEAVTAQ